MTAHTHVWRVTTLWKLHGTAGIPGAFLASVCQGCGRWTSTLPAPAAVADA